MKAIIKNLNLKEDEEVIEIVHQYLLTYWPSIFLVMFLILAPFFFLFPLFSLGFWGIVIFLFSLIVGIIYGLRKFIIWYFNVFVITNQRIIDIDQRGFFDRIVSEAPYEKIQDVSYRIKGLIKTLFHYGNIQIQTAGSQVCLELKDIKEPEKIQALIAMYQNERKKKITENLQNVNENDFENVKNKISQLSFSQLRELNEKIKEEMRNKTVKFLSE
jgi:uncharacterized membrane protein YdbT with pleckstrin-like domain